MSERIAAEVARLRVEMEMLTAGLMNMAATQEAHTSMLTQALTSRAAEPVESPLIALFTELIVQIKRQTEVMLSLDASREDDADEPEATRSDRISRQRPV